MKVAVIDSQSRIENIFEGKRETQQNESLYYFVNSTLPDYKPMIYGVASRPITWVVYDYLKKIFSLS